MLKQPMGWANDIEIIEECILHKITHIKIHELEEDVFYIASLETIQQKGFKINRKFGVQIILLLKYWEKIDNKKVFVQKELF